MIRTVRKRPIRQKAVRWTGENAAELVGWTMRESGQPGFVPTGDGEHGELYVAANRAWATIPVGWWVLAEAVGEGFYPCSPQVLAVSYDIEVDEAAVAEG